MQPANPNPNPSLIETSFESFSLKKLHGQGVVVVKGLFPAFDMVALRRNVEGVCERSHRDKDYLPTNSKYSAGSTILGDLLSIDDLHPWDHIALHPRVVQLAKTILGPDIVYFGDSCIRCGNGGRGFHKDFVDKTPPTRGMVRFILYLQDHSAHSGGLKVRLRSHRYDSRHFGTMMNLATTPRDLVIFYLRTSHTGNNVILKKTRALCLHPKLENLVPSSFCLPEEQHRLCLLWTFGVASESLDLYFNYIRSYPDHWQHIAWTPAVRQLADQRGVSLKEAAMNKRVLCEEFASRE